MAVWHARIAIAVVMAPDDDFQLYVDQDRDHRQKQADLITQGKLPDAVEMDIDDLQSKFGNKYDNNIRQMLDEFGDEF